MREVEVKGHCFKVLISAIEHLWGSELLEQLLRQGPQELNESIRFGALVAGGWYPIAWYRGVHSELATLLPTERNIPQSIGRIATEMDLRGFNRWLLQLVTPKTLIYVARRGWGVYFRGGLTESQSIPGGAEVRIVDCGGMDIRILNEWCAGVQYLIELTGEQNVRFTAKMEAADQARTRFYWR